MGLWQRSRALRITTWVVAAIAVVVVGPWAAAYWHTEHALRVELQRIRDAGEPVSMADLVPPPVPDNQNAALVYARYYPPDGRGPDDLTFAQPGDEELLRRFQSDATVEPQVRRMLARSEVVEALAAIRRASHLPYAIAPDWTPDGGRAPSMLGTYYCAQWLGAAAVLAARDGRGGDAATWMAVIFRIADQLDGDARSLYGRRVRARGCVTGWRVLGEVAMPAAKARALMRQIRTPNQEQAAYHSLCTHRAQINDRFSSDPLQFALDVGLEVSDLRPGRRAFLSRYNSLILRPMRNADQLALLADLRGGLDAISTGGARAQLPRQAQAEPRGLVELLGAVAAYLHPDSSLVGLPHDIGTLVLGGTTRDAAYVNLFRTGLALVAHKQEHGAYPRTLADLRLPPGCDPTGDPFSGGPLKYARQGDGFILYSVGYNGVDDLGVTGNGSDGDIVESLPR